MKEKLYLVLLRVGMGWIFLWAFLDKLFGLGSATTPDKAWLNGVSPTAGFLKFGVYGPFQSFFNSLSGNVIVDWLFMMGLLGVGVALTLGIGKKIATMSGSLLMILMWLALFPPKNNPFLDDHIIYLFVLQLLLQLDAGEVFGLGKWWNKTILVKKYPFLK